MFVIDKLGDAALTALGMAWQTGWSLVLGFAVSALLETVVRSDEMRRVLGRGGPREIAIATVAGAASSSCSYASAAITRTLFKKGAALAPALAFLVASTNIVLELGLILLVLLGWQFTAAEWGGGVLLVVILSLLVRATYPKDLVEAARHHEEVGGGHSHSPMTTEGATWRERLRAPDLRVRVAQNFAMEWSMLWKDLVIGFGVAGLIAALVPTDFWRGLFVTSAPAAVRVPLDALIGPIVAIFTFVCSVGNVPLAAVLWAGGASFGGVVAFLFADLIVLPLLDVYRRYYGWRMAAYIGGLLFVSMVLAAIVIDLVFAALGLQPAQTGDAHAHLAHFSLNYTFWLNLLFGALGLYLFVLARRHPMAAGHCG